MIDLKRYLDTMEFAKFMPEGKIHEFLDRIGHRMGELTADISILLTRMGLYPGTYLYDWLGPILRELDAETFGKLRVSRDGRSGYESSDRPPVPSARSYIGRHSASPGAPALGLQPLRQAA